MNWRILPVAVCIASATPAHGQSNGAPAAGSQPQAVVKDYCVGCHNDRLKQGNLVLSTLDVTQPGPNAAIWEKAIRKVRAGMMPPAGARRPDAAKVEALASSLETALDTFAATTPNPGRPSTPIRSGTCLASKSTAPRSCLPTT
jgi:mono/diheme cytochrome c family protein